MSQKHGMQYPEARAVILQRFAGCDMAATPWKTLAGAFANIWLDSSLVGHSEAYIVAEVARQLRCDACVLEQQKSKGEPSSRPLIEVLAPLDGKDSIGLERLLSSLNRED